MTLGAYWAAYAGPTDQNSPHDHVAVQLTVGIGDDEVTVELGKRRVSARAVLVRPLAVHRVAPDLDSAAFFYVEPQASLGKALLNLLGDAAAIAAPLTVARAVAGLRGEPAAGIARLERVLGVPTRPSLDRRLASALALLENAAGEPGGVGRAAAAAGISQSRFRAPSSGRRSSAGSSGGS